MDSSPIFTKFSLYYLLLAGGNDASRMKLGSRRRKDSERKKESERVHVPFLCERTVGIPLFAKHLFRLIPLMTAYDEGRSLRVIHIICQTFPLSVRQKSELSHSQHNFSALAGTIWQQMRERPSS